MNAEARASRWNENQTARSAHTAERRAGLQSEGSGWAPQSRPLSNAELDRKVEGRVNDSANRTGWGRKAPAFSLPQGGNDA